MTTDSKMCPFAASEDFINSILSSQTRDRETMKRWVSECVYVCACMFYQFFVNTLGKEHSKRRAIHSFFDITAFWEELAAMGR
jgi:hypothetical protein